MIERKKLRKRKPPRLGHKKSGGSRNYNFQNNIPRSRVDISKALEKYNNLAQDAQSNGDRIVAEGFYQYAEHYQRMLNDQPKLDLNNIGKNKSETTTENSEEKLSRTERAINAKNARLNDPKKQSNSGFENIQISLSFNINQHPNVKLIYFRKLKGFITLRELHINYK